MAILTTETFAASTLQKASASALTGQEVIRLVQDSTSVKLTIDTLAAYVAGDFQAADDDLTAIAALTPTDGNFIVGDGATWVTESGATARASLGLTIGTHVQAWDAQLDSLSSASANGVSLVTSADYAAMRALLDLEAGTDVQAYDADLASWAGVTRASGFDTFAATPSSANLRALLTDETGTGAAYFQGGDAGTPSVLVLTNATGLTSAGVAAATLVTAADTVASNDNDTTWPTTAAIIDYAQPLDSDLTAIAALTTTAGGRSVLTMADPNADRIMAWDDSAGAITPIALADIAAEATPASGDFFLVYLADGSLAKVDFDDMPGAGGGISNVSEDTDPALGGDLDLNSNDIIGTGNINITGTATATSFSGPLTGNVTGNTDTVTWANEATDTTCFIGFATAASGSLAPKTNANMTFNSNTGVATFASTVLTTTDINGGTVDGAVIGGSSAAAGTFTTLSATGNVSFDGGTLVFNESGADKDLRAEGDTDANLLFLDASTDRVGIGTASPGVKFHVNGAGVYANGLSVGFTTAPTDDHLKVADANFGFEGSATVPLIVYDGNDYNVYNRSSNFWDWVIGGSTVVRLTATSLSIGTTTANSISAIGFKEVSYSGGTQSGAGTYTPDAANGNKQHITNGGNFTLAPPSASSTIEIEITNNGSAGTITTSGFTKVGGDSFTTTNGHKFLCCVSKSQTYSLLIVTALQ